MGYQKPYVALDMRRCLSWYTFEKKKTVEFAADVVLVTPFWDFRVIVSFILGK